MAASLRPTDENVHAGVDRPAGAARCCVERHTGTDAGRATSVSCAAPRGPAAPLGVAPPRTAAPYSPHEPRSPRTKVPGPRSPRSHSPITLDPATLGRLPGPDAIAGAPLRARPRGSSLTPASDRRRMDMTGRGMDTTATTHGHPRRQRRLATLLGLALVSGSLGAGALSLALFTDSQAVTGNAFATGTIDISTTPATALFSVSAMMPGDTSSQPIVVNNAGSGALRYAISTAIVSGPTLAAQLQLDIYAGATCTGTPLYTGALGTAALGSNVQGRAGRRPRARRRDERVALLQGDPAARDREHLPEHDDQRDLHLRRRADGQQLAVVRPASSAHVRHRPAVGRPPSPAPRAGPRITP